MFKLLEIALGEFANIELTNEPDFFSKVVSQKLEELYHIFNDSQYQQLPISPYLNYIKEAILKEQQFCYGLEMIHLDTEKEGLLKLIKNNIAQKHAHINMALITIANRIPVSVLSNPN